MQFDAPEDRAYDNWTREQGYLEDDTQLTEWFDEAEERIEEAVAAVPDAGDRNLPIEDQPMDPSPLIQEFFVKDMVTGSCLNPPAVRVFVGYLGRSPRGTDDRPWYRLYFKLDFTEFIEVARDAIVYQQKSTGFGLPIEATILWIRSNAEIWHTKIESQPLRASEFLRGRLADQELMRSQSSVLQSTDELVDTPSWSAGCG